MKQIVCLLICFSVITFGQSLQNDNIRFSSFEKFNERGYTTSASNNISGKEVISEYDGNVSVVYNSELDIPNDLGGNLSIIYNNNVEHRVFINLQFTNQLGYPVNAGEWIIGYKGFALQTLNFEANFYTLGTDTIGIGENVAMLIPGYNYSNKLNESNTNQPPGVEDMYDVIEILKADGSKMTLMNQDMIFHQGTYYEVGFDARGVAKVQVIDPDDESQRREMWYKPGDGLTYYFKENIVYYSGFDYANGEQAKYNPKTFYLKYVANANKDTIRFGYNRTFDAQQNDQTYYSRELFQSISSTIKSSLFKPIITLDYLIMNVFGSSHLAGINVYNDWKSDRFTIALEAGLQYGSYWHSTTRKYDPTASKIKHIKWIVDDLGRRDNFYYQDYQKTFKYTVGGNTAFGFEPPARQIKQIDYHNNRKVKFTYNYNYLNEDYNYYYNELTTPVSSLKNTGRGLDVNYAVATYKVFSGNSLIKEDEYEYFMFGGTYNKHESYSGVVTKITQNNQIPDGDESMPGTMTITKSFSNYKVNYRANYHADYSSVIRLDKVTKESENTKIEIINDWYKGDTVENGGDHYLNGNMWLKSVTERTTRYPNSYPEIVENVSNYVYTSGSYDLPFGPSRHLKTSETVTDSYGKTTYRKYKNDINFNNISSSDYYKFGVLEEEKITGENGTIKKHLKYSFYSNSPLIGKLHEVVDLQISPDHKTEYFYEDQGIYAGNYQTYPLYRGLLTEEHLPNNVIKKYYYPGVYLRQYDPGGWRDGEYMPPEYKYIPGEEVVGKLVKPDGSYETREFQIGYQTKPYKTEIIYKSGNDTIRTFSDYNRDGTLAFEIDANGNYGEYFYDEGGRLTKANLPGSFFVEPDSNYQNVTLDLVGKTTQGMFCASFFLKVEDGGQNPTYTYDDYLTFFNKPFIPNDSIDYSSIDLILNTQDSYNTSGFTDNFYIYGILEPFNHGQTELY